MLLLAVFLWMVIASIGSGDKRILLNDPDYVTHFQSQIQELQTKFNSQQSHINHLEAKIGSQETTISHQGTTISQQGTTISQQGTTISKQATTLANLQAQSGNSALFTRWGRKDCPSHITTLVYSGYAGGSFYSHTGGAAEYVCLPSDPIWGPHKDVSSDEYVGYMYGAEYEEPAALFGIQHNDDVPCAVCLGTGHSASLMIPGRTQCYQGWTQAYSGNLASGYHANKAASQYVCVDDHPQALDGGGSMNNDGKLFNGVKSKCGSLRCPPYEEGKFLSCVVCLR